MPEGSGTTKSGTLKIRQTISHRTSVPSSTPVGRRTGRTRRSSAASMRRLLASGEDQTADLVAVVLEARVELHLDGAGTGQVHIEHKSQATGPRGHHHHAVGEQDRLRDAVGHEEDRL